MTEKTGGTAATRAKNRYSAKKYDSLRVITPKGRKDIIKAHAAKHGESMNRFVNRAINEAMQRDNTPASTIDSKRQERL